MATSYTPYTGYSGCTLFIIETDPSNIRLLNLRAEGNMARLCETDYMGINGTWFNSGSDQNQKVIDIAMQDGKTVGPDSDEGLINNIGTGAVAWNGSQVSCYAAVTEASEISFSDRRGTWVQGGIPLMLGYSAWKTQARKNNGSIYVDEGSSFRSALIAHMHKNRVFLIITRDIVKTSVFREAIQSFFNISDGNQANNDIQGIMLDGGSSSQLKTNNMAIPANAIPGVTRDLAQIVSLRAWR